MAKATGPIYRVPFRRRRKNLTNYKKRLGLLKSGKCRMVVRKSLKQVLVQFIQYTPKGDEVIASAISKEIEKFGWCPKRNIPTAYLTGYLCGKRALNMGIKEFVLDIGLHTPSKSCIGFAALKGAVDAGLKTNHGENIFDMSRIRGEHITQYANKLKGTPRYEKIFSKYIKAGVAPEKLSELFDKVKDAIHKTGE